jgi:hypothetical protein
MRNQRVKKACHEYNIAGVMVGAPVGDFSFIKNFGRFKMI